MARAHLRWHVAGSGGKMVVRERTHVRPLGGLEVDPQVPRSSGSQTEPSCRPGRPKSLRQSLHAFRQFCFQLSLQFLAFFLHGFMHAFWHLYFLGGAKGDGDGGGALSKVGPRPRSTGSHCGGTATGWLTSANLLATLDSVMCGRKAARKARRRRR